MTIIIAITVILVDQRHSRRYPGTSRGIETFVTLIINLVIQVYLMICLNFLIIKFDEEKGEQALPVYAKFGN